ncbi:hypothetical protein HYZ97_01360, partial [Candidatus Pacearchaeota archaeon]|nr:hypothetical protein [Candidatus Pacearchaeota archaeon]
LISQRIIEQVPSITGRAIDTAQSCADQFYFLITGTIQNGQVMLTDKEIERGCAGSNGFGDYTVSVLDSQESILLTDSFNPELVFTDLQHDETEEIEGETFAHEGSFYLRVPALDNAAKLEIYDANQKIHSSLTVHTLDSYACRIE